MLFMLNTESMGLSLVCVICSDIECVRESAFCSYPFNIFISCIGLRDFDICFINF